MTTDGDPDGGTRDSAALERENLRLTATLRRVRSRLEAALDEDGGESALREALEEARRATVDGESAARGADGGSEQEERGRMNPSPSEVLGDTEIDRPPTTK